MVRDRIDSRSSDNYKIVTVMVSLLIMILMIRVIKP